MNFLFPFLFFQIKTKVNLWISHFSEDSFSSNENTQTSSPNENEDFSGKINVNKNNNSSNNYLLNLLSERWFRIAFILILVIVGFLLLNLIGPRIALLFFTISPLVIGYGLVSALQPLQRFFQHYVSQRTAKIAASSIFLFIILIIIIGIFVVFFFELETLYNRLIKADGDEEINKLLQKLNGEGKDGIKLSNIHKIDFVHSSKQGSSSEVHKLTISLINGEDEMAEYSGEKVGSLYTLIFWLIDSVPILKSIGINLIRTAYGWGHTGYIERVFLNYAIVFGFVYIIFFSLIIMMFAVFEPPRNFFRRIWSFLIHGQPSQIRTELEFKLKKKLKGWLRGLFLDQLYVLIGTALVLLLMGIIFPESKLLGNVIVLSIIAASFNLIPYIGPWIGGIFIGGFVLSTVVETDASQFVSWLPFIFTMIGILIIQIGESALVAPIVYSNNVQLSPIAIIILLLVFGVLFGIWSMPFAIPVLLIAQTVSEVVYKWKWKL